MAPGLAALKSLRTGGVKSVNDLVSEMALNSGLARTLLAKVPTDPRGAQGYWRLLAQQIRTLGVRTATRTAGNVQMPRVQASDYSGSYVPPPAADNVSRLPFSMGGGRRIAAVRRTGGTDGERSFSVRPCRLRYDPRKRSVHAPAPPTLVTF